MEESMLSSTFLSPKQPEEEEVPTELVEHGGQPEEEQATTYSLSAFHHAHVTYTNRFCRGPNSGQVGLIRSV